MSKHPFFSILLWLLTGTTLLAQTRMVRQINPGAAGANPYDLVNVNGTLYFAADNGTQGIELWKSNGTDAGTTLVKDIVPGAEHAFPARLTDVNGTLFFVVGSALWKSNGTAAGTVPVKSFASVGDASAFCNVNGVLYFAASDGVNGEELWKSDGTAAGTTMVRDLIPGLDEYGSPAGSAPRNLFGANGAVYFNTRNGGVYRSNGTAAGTIQLSNSAFSHSFAAYKGLVYFLGNGLWKTDGTPAGTVQVSTLPTPGDDSFSGGSSKLIVSNNALYFYTGADLYTNVVWISDGTTAGTRIIKELGSISTPTTSELVDVNGTVFFAHSIGTSNKALYKIIGSTAYVVRDMGFGTAPDFSYFTSLNGYLVFPEYDGNGGGDGPYSALGTELWRSDGTDAGTIVVEDIRKTSVDWDASSYPMFLTPVNGVLYFTADDGVNGRELWKYDPSVTPNPVLRLNAGGPEYVESGAYRTFSADQYVTGGSVANLITSPEIANTDLDTLYHTERWGSFAYSIPVKPGKYYVNLHFAEIHWGNGRAGGAGSRKFNVDIEGTRRLTEYDIFATTGGALRADVKQFQLEVTDGTLNINFLPGTASQPKVSAIEVLPVTVSPLNNPPVMAAIGNKTVTAGQTLTFTAQAIDNDYPHQHLTFSLAGSVPAGATIVTSQAFVNYTMTATGAFSWTPAQPGTYTFRVKITDNGYPATSDEEQITVTVNPSATAATAFRVNAGGTAFSTIDARGFAADAYFSGGSLSTTTALGIGGTADDYLYQTGRHGSSFSYNFPTGNGAYDVVLHFAETYWGNTAPGGIGSRAFHVNMEGARKLTDYDIYARAGGALRVAQETFRVNVTDGTLNVAFLKGAADNPAIKAIEVLPAGSALTINAGGGAFTSGTGKRFSADSYYASGSVSSIPSGSIANTGDDALYRNARFGAAFSYGLPSGNGTFDVTLHFAETYWGSRAAGGVGSRKFNVYVENVKRLSEYDVFAKAGGAMRAVKETVRVTVTDGILNLYFAKGATDFPLVSAIEVVPVAAAARTAEEVAGTETWKATLFPNPAAGQLTVTLPFSADAVTRTTVTDPAGNARLLNAHQVSGVNQLLIGVGTLPGGLYLLKIDTEHGRQVLKFVKQ